MGRPMAVSAFLKLYPDFPGMRLAMTILAAGNHGMASGMALHTGHFSVL